jgi:hypothetical protein
MRTLRLTLVSLALAGTAFASSGYPTVVHDHLALSTFPQCTLCHTTLAGGAGTANQPFGVSVRNHGAVGGEQDAKLITALDALASANVDSDGDGVPDITELKNGTDPNVKAAVDGGTPAPTLPEPPRYGCGAETTPAVLGLWAALATLAVAFRRR